MPRKVPWSSAKQGDVSQARISKPASRPSRPRFRVKEDEDEKKKNASKEQSTFSKRDFLRSSPTPPSSPIHRCPSEEFLIEGLENDDLCIMVEDEFYTVAQSFTQHLHYAEYVRRKKEAKLQNATAIENIARPTDGVTPMREELKKKHVANALSARQEQGLDQVLGKRPRVDADVEEADEDISWAGTSLHNLMVSPRKTRSLVVTQGIKSSTRAAAGFSQAISSHVNARDQVDNDRAREQQRDEEDMTAGTASDEDDDLDLGATLPSTAVSRKHDRSSRDLKLPRSSPSPLTLGSEENTRKLNTPIRRSLTTVKTERRMIFDDFEELPEPHKPSLKATQTKAQRNDKDNNTGSKKSRLNEVPTFLI